MWVYIKDIRQIRVLILYELLGFKCSPHQKIDKKNISEYIELGKRQSANKFSAFIDYSKCTKGENRDFTTINVIMFFKSDLDNRERQTLKFT